MYSLKIVQAYECTTISLRHLAHQRCVAINALLKPCWAREDCWKANAVNAHEAITVSVFDIDPVYST